jgi:hypothetical protein
MISVVTTPLPMPTAPRKPSDRAKLVFVYALQVVLACALMVHWFWWAPGGRAGPNPDDPWPVYRQGGFKDNIGQHAIQLALVGGCLWTERLKIRIARRMALPR